MAAEMLVATQQAAWAAQSAAEAAWYALLLNGMAVAVTGGALWFAASQYFKASQFERFRATASLTRMIELIEPIADACVLDEKGMIVPEIAWPIVSDRLFERALDRLPTVSLEHVPDHDIVNYAETLPVILRRLRDQWEDLRWPQSAVSGETIEVRYVCEATDYARLLRNALRSGSRADRAAVEAFKSIS